MDDLVADGGAVGRRRLVACDGEREQRLRRPELDDAARAPLVAVQAGRAVGRAEHEREPVLVARDAGALVRGRRLGDAVGRRARDEACGRELELLAPRRRATARSRRSTPHAGRRRRAGRRPAGRSGARGRPPGSARSTSAGRPPSRSGSGRASPRRLLGADGDVVVAVEDAVARSLDIEQERPPVAVGERADPVGARLDLARDRDEPRPSPETWG